MHRIGFVVFADFQLMDMTAITVFEAANLTTGNRIYDVTLLSDIGGPVPTSTGLSVGTEPFSEQTFDTVMVAGGTTVGTFSPKFTAFIKRSFRASRRVVALCTAAFALAEAGLLDGRRATTHWLYARDLQRRFPKVRVEENRIYIIDGPVWTSAGMVATVDLALAMVDADLGADVARRLVLYHRRAGGQSQLSTLLELGPRSDRIQRALDHASRNLKRPLSINELAAVAHLSPRQFSRAFRAETGRSPAKAVEQLRVEAARFLMEQGRHSMDVIAAETGFADRERMRHAFLRTLGRAPRVVRRSARNLRVAAPPTMF
jgi:transcriptional regulator GlxA family with amidase domain